MLMADDNSGPKRPKNDAPVSPASAGSGGDCAPPRERDFGDSAGYGSGGSALDFHDVGDEDANPVKGKPNPLDDVIDAENGGPPTRSPGGS
jgi:hypothetical protein